MFEHLNRPKTLERKEVINLDRSFVELKNVFFSGEEFDYKLLDVRSLRFCFGGESSGPCGKRDMIGFDSGICGDVRI